MNIQLILHSPDKGFSDVVAHHLIMHEIHHLQLSSDLYRSFLTQDYTRYPSGGSSVRWYYEYRDLKKAYDDCEE